jgi:hypothetical protein
MSADTSDLDGLERDLRKIPALMVPKLKGVVAKSAVNTKKLMQADARKSPHFKALARTITYDLRVMEFFGDGVIEAEIGPSNSGGFGGEGGVGSQTGGSAASLAGIAYYGTSRPGGGTVRNPEDAMLEEAPNFYEFAFKATEGLL